MKADRQRSPNVHSFARGLLLAVLALALVRPVRGQTPERDTAAKLKDFDAWMTAVKQRDPSGEFTFPKK